MKNFKEGFAAGIISLASIVSGGCVAESVASLREKLGSSSDNVLPPDTSSLKWVFVETSSFNKSLDKILSEKDYDVVLIGEPIQPYWLGVTPTANVVGRELFPVLKKHDFSDVVVGYLTQDVSYDDIALSLKPKVRNVVTSKLGDFCATGLIDGARESGMQLHHGGYKPKRGFSLDRIDWYSFGLGATERQVKNENFIAAVKEVSDNTSAQLGKLLSDKKKAVAYLPLYLVDPNKDSLHGQTFFEYDEKMYTAVHHASLVKKFRENNHPKAKVLCLVVFDPTIAGHANLMGRPDYWFGWTVKSELTRQVGTRDADGYDFVMLLDKYQKGLSSPTLERRMKEDSGK